MDGKKQLSTFFNQLRKLGADLDRGKKLCQTTELDYLSQSTCINSLKGYADNLQEKLVVSKQIYAEQEASFVKFQSILDLVEDVVDQQKSILQSQETFMEQYGFLSYEKSCSEKKEKDNGTQEPETSSPAEENVSPERTAKEDCADEGSPQTPKLEDFGLSHYTMLKLQNPQLSVNRSVTTQCIATPTVFQHDGLFMSPSVLDKMPSLYTPDPRNTVEWPASVSYSAKRCPYPVGMSKKICKNLQMEMDNDDDDILNQCPSAPSLSATNRQNLNLDIYQLPPTPKSAVKPTALKATESIFNKPKDYLMEELPQPPKLNSKLRLPFPHGTPKDRPKTRLEAPLSARNTKYDLDTPSPPLLHTTLLSSSDDHISPNIPAEPVLSCRKKDKINYFEKDIPEPPELTGVYRYPIRNKENRLTKNNFL